MSLYILWNYILEIGKHILYYVNILLEESLEKHIHLHAWKNIVSVLDF